MILGWSSFKVVQMVPVHCISRSQELKIDFLTKNLKNLLVRNHWTDFNIILQKCSFGDPLPRLFRPFGFVKKHGRQGAGLIFPIYLYRKLQKYSRGWSGGAKVLCILHHWGVQLILAYSWARPAILVVGKGRGGMFLFLLFLHFHSCSSFFPVPLFHLLYSLSSISFLPFSGRRHKMTLKG